MCATIDSLYKEQSNLGVVKFETLDDPNQFPSGVNLHVKQKFGGSTFRIIIRPSIKDMIFGRSGLKRVTIASKNFSASFTLFKIVICWENMPSSRGLSKN